MQLKFLASLLLLAACASAEPSAVTVAAAPTWAAPVIPYDPSISRDPAAAPAGEYTLDSSHASVTWRLRHLGMSLFTARFSSVHGALVFDPQAPENSTVRVEIATASVDTGIVNRAGERGFDAAIANTRLGAEANPTITFVSTSVRRTGPTTGVITGDLTLNGQTHPITIDASFHGGTFVEFRNRDAIGFEGHTSFDRTQWGVVDDNTGPIVEAIIQVEFFKVRA